MIEEPDYSDADWQNHYAVKLRTPTEAEQEEMEYAADLAYDAQRESCRPQNGRICNCEDAPCCGHYD